ncbi:GNAT family N-acetyltransferase [Pacificoceanicola onchidii]|uniref:GNAT family N-acetyltransferase n=1 Tax=Pacificoceanicola onchidii TaxID=2562685 RepID=UPI0010A2FD1E|nr:GNAT family N-acetyltransferase [Pacificoceanicola onchidii]
MINTATEQELPDLVPLLRDLNALHARHLPERFHTRGSDAAILRVLTEAQASGTQFLVYRTEGVARGYLAWMARPVPGADDALQEPQRMALLDHIYVTPISRRRGIASRLIARFEAEIAESFDGWKVQVHAFNAASAALMMRHGAQLAVQVYGKAL